MNTETILTRVNAVAAYCDASPVARLMLADLAADLEADIRTACAKRQGKGSAVKAMTAVLNARKKVSQERDGLRYAWQDGAGRQCICDGFQAYRLREPLPLEPRPDDADKPLDLDKVIPADLTGLHAIPLPTAAELRAHLKTVRAKNGRKAVAVWDMGDGASSYNAEQLLNALAVLPDASEAYVKDGAAALSCPLYIKTDSGEAYIMPCYTDAKRDAIRAAKDAEAAEKAAWEAAETPEERAAKEDAAWRKECADHLHRMLEDYEERNACAKAYGHEEGCAMCSDEFAAMAYYAAQLQAPAV